MIWVGAGDRSLANLAAAVPGGDCPSTAVLGQADQPAMLASRLAKKLNKQVDFTPQTLKILILHAGVCELQCA